MKFIDKVLRQWRVNVALKSIPNHVNAVFDIGCDDGYLLNLVAREHMQLDGCDPRLNIPVSVHKSSLLKGFFPAVMDEFESKVQYDVIFALAVFEHFTEDDLIKSSLRISEMLTESGRLIVTVPHPFVDNILDVLMALRLIEGQALEEHHGFDPESLVKILSKGLVLKSRKRFQLGLNNLFVFQKQTS
jgi:2-polyprenyl-3-methyl-5-hydroxy-6-metoxy-1,4-benzoquinol methylase